MMLMLSPFLNISLIAGGSSGGGLFIDTLLLAPPIAVGIVAAVRASSGSRKSSKPRTAASAKAEAERSERLLESIATNFPDGLVLALDRKLKFLFIGGTEVADLKKSVKYWMGRGITENFHPSINANGIAQLRKALEGMPTDYEVVSGSQSYRVTATPITTKRKETEEILVIVRNITATVRLENNLKRAQQKEKEFNILRSRFVTLASHEFRTPLSTILTSVFLLENYSGDDYEQEKLSYIDKIKRAVHSLTDLLNNFLAIGKLEEGKIKVEITDLEIKPFLEGILQEVVSIRKVRQDIMFKFESDYEWIQTDKQLLRHIVVNLLTNAIKYSPPHEEIRLDAQVSSGTLLIRVVDKGTGIPEHEQSHIFKRFFRGQNASNIDGTGLGLNLVKKYVRLLKGTIQFTSQVNKGSTFTVRIPVAPALEKQVG
jgi:signal transduction histidine kinase